MLIRCPECRFERNIDADSIPVGATVATCPRCGKRFRFRDPQTGEPAAPQPDAGHNEASAEAERPAAPELPTPPVPHLPTEQEGDDPLPPGAVIPHLNDAPDAMPPGDAEHAAPKDDIRREDRTAPSRSAKRLWFGRKKREDGASPTDDLARNPAPWASRAENPDVDGGAEGKGPFADTNGAPWEQPERYGFFSGFYQTILRVMFRAPDFFRHVRSDAPLTRPVFFYVLLSFFQTLFAHLWSMNSLQELSRTVTDPQTLARIDLLMQGLSTPLVLVMTPFIMLIQLFLFAAFYHLMIRLAQPDKADFNTVVRVIAYSAAPLVVCVVPVAGSAVGSAWFLASTFIGCKYALNLTWSKTALALVPLFLLALAVMLALVQASLMSIPAAS